MQKIKKIQIRVNGKVKSIPVKHSISDLVKNLNIPIKKVAIEYNQEIIDKKKINRIILKKNDKIEIVHFIGGG
ncbi:sulfur carrier protein ThiS [Pelagibacterales bacterium SAG-MED25]|uniref:sulfur carrier protein ThiS n=1 Tax=Pelagibacter sp. (strain HTCC7211) TaxID=439493 RepID=UPI0002E5A564|nr:sulfur carrier protein ThiS [Candidatus Pelagibacter sp. HTCC7211]MBD1151098.1 sulfur carrier protein ThiS [Pelagibacterales bacterium SAG-MED25]